MMATGIGDFHALHALEKLHDGKAKTDQGNGCSDPGEVGALERKTGANPGEMVVDAGRGIKAAHRRQLVHNVPLKLQRRDIGEMSLCDG